MQRRAAAIYALLFLLVGAGSYTLIVTASPPELSFQDSDDTIRLGANETFTVDGKQYTASEISASASEGEISRSGTIAWQNRSARFTATLQNGSNVTLDGTSYQVLIPNQSGTPNSFTLSENVNRTRILQNDSRADNQTVTRNGTAYVVIEENDGNATLVPADRYFPDPRTRQVAEGDRFPYQNNTTTVSNVTNESVTLAWTGTENLSAQASNLGNVTLNNQTYLAYFPNNETMVLTKDFETYDAYVDQTDQQEEFTRGLWFVVILSFVTVVVLIAMAYLPSRY